jgi:hypothetical protein
MSGIDHHHHPHTWPGPSYVHVCVFFCVCILQNKMLDDIVVVIIEVSTILLQSLKISQQQPFRNVMSHLQTMKIERVICVCVCVCIKGNY